MSMKKFLIMGIVICVIMQAVCGVGIVLATEENSPLFDVMYSGGGNYTVSADDLEEGKEYRVFAAVYDSSNRLEKGCVRNINAVNGAISTDFDFQAYVKADKEVRFFLWNEGAKPISATMTVDKNFGVTEIAEGKGVYGTGLDGEWSNLKLMTPSAVTDNDPETSGGFYAKLGTRGHIYIDLEAEYKIDRIDILAYNSSYADRTGNFDLVLSKSVTEGEKCSDKKRFDVAFVPSNNVTTVEEAKYSSYYVNSDDTYRYVSLEKFEANTYGLFIADVRVYVRNGDMPKTPVFVDVAQDKNTGGKFYNGTVLTSPMMYSADNINDGNEENVGGFYYSYFKGYMYIDLGRAYKIDRIEFLSYNQYRPYVAGNFDIIVGNSVPDAVPYNGENPNGEHLIAHVPADNGATSAAVGYKRFSSDGGSYRYVAFEKLQENNEGLLLNEVKVYVNAQDMPKEDTEIGDCFEMANNKVTRTASDSTPKPLLVDGDRYTVAEIEGSGCMYIDLQRRYKIHHIDVLTYDEEQTGTTGDFNIVVGNTTPDNAAWSSGSGGRLVAHVSEQSRFETADAAEYQTYFMPSGSGYYRFVSFEKFKENSEGLRIAEVRVYVKEADMLFDFDKYMQPVWNGNTIYDESVTFTPNAVTGEIDPVPLLYKPTRILTVKSYDRTKEYIEGTDFVVSDDGELLLTENSGITAWNFDEYYSTSTGESYAEWLALPGRYAGNSDYLTKQYYVTYEHNGEWSGETPEYAGANLTKTVQKLNNGENLRVLFYGDSITWGCDASSSGDETLASGYTPTYARSFAPYMPIYPKLVVRQLEKAYPNGKIEYMNNAVPGWASYHAQLAENLDERIRVPGADLVVIAFGMNDGTITTDTHYRYINYIMDAAREVNPNVEFILVSTMLPNTETKFSEYNQILYQPVLEKIQAENKGIGVAVAKVTDIHLQLLKKKRFGDMTGSNGLNHPNDFLARVYAQVLSKLLIENY